MLSIVLNLLRSERQDRRGACPIPVAAVVADDDAGGMACISSSSWVGEPGMVNDTVGAVDASAAGWPRCGLVV